MSNSIPKSVRGAMTMSTTSPPLSPIVACLTGLNIIGSRLPTDLMKRLQLTRGEMRRWGCMNRKTPRKTLLDRLSGPDHPSQTTMIPNTHRKEESTFWSSPGLTLIQGNHPSQNLSNSPKLLSRISPAISSSPNPMSSIQSNVHSSLTQSGKISWPARQSTSTILDFLDKVYPDVNFRPDYICIDKGCQLLRHAVASSQWDGWKDTTRFIVDLYHYINHRTTDYLCRKYCNPAPLNGSAPNLVTVEHDNFGIPHFKCAFNTQASFLSHI